MFNILYIQSGGPTTVINSSACGVIKACKKNADTIKKIYTCKYGFWGLLHNDMIDITHMSDENLEKLQRTPGMAFGSSRYRIPEGDSGLKDYEKIHAVLREHNIGIIIVNGGNGSVRASHDLSQYLQSINYDCSVVVVPKTVDNDIAYIDHAPGFPSAARNMLLTLQELSHDFQCYNTPLLCIVEVMGRDTGWLAASAILLEEYGCAPDLIYVPEIPFSRETFVADAKAVLKKKGKCIAVVAEGVKENGRYIFDLTKDAQSAYLNMGGTVASLRSLIVDRFDCKVRAIDLGLMQR
ncbi:MAG: diphosphate--fructose-6-phosphate 1-phosphotransferase, partial [Spirochaetales bacterium]